MAPSMGVKRKTPSAKQEHVKSVPCLGQLQGLGQEPPNLATLRLVDFNHKVEVHKVEVHKVLKLPSLETSGLGDSQFLWAVHLLSRQPVQAAAAMMPCVPAIKFIFSLVKKSVAIKKNQTVPI
uniref:Uncharacterized protein n=1 Tax=Micrurus corallinus TaxID=54390 RepID=A0A2D4G7J5_MICCO